MKHRAIVLAWVLTVNALGALAASASRADTPHRLTAAGTAAISQVLTQAVERGDTPGAVGLIVDGNGVLFQGAAGKLDLARGTPLGTDAIFNIASMTKPVTSVAIMMLMEQGKLSLDDPVSKFLPGFDNLKVITKFNPADGSYETRPAKRAMTIRHLLTHTSGLGYAFSNPVVALLLKGTQRTEWELPLLCDPGEQWNYSASTRVLGLIVEKITGVSLETYYQQHILGPLGMVDTSFAVPADKQARLITIYEHVNGKMQEQKPRAVVPTTPTPPLRGDGGLYSTAHDYGQFIRMLLNGGHLGGARILSKRSVELMSQNQIGVVFVSQQQAAMPQVTRPFPLGAGRDKFGLGFQITEPDPSGGGAHRSPGSLSWAGIFNTEFWIDPHRGIGGVLLMQYLPFYDDAALRTLGEFETAVYTELGK